MLGEQYHGGGAVADECLLAGRLLFGCSGYYNHDAGHTIEFDGQAAFGGKIIHPQVRALIRCVSAPGGVTVLSSNSGLFVVDDCHTRAMLGPSQRERDTLRRFSQWSLCFHSLSLSLPTTQTE